MRPWIPSNDAIGGASMAAAWATFFSVSIISAHRRSLDYNKHRHSTHLPITPFSYATLNRQEGGP
ncbi:hypothetical protein JXO52_04800 [bacterium]|nr:hypothetical protein [bacterium]